jgi:predicted GNAT family acetyltransferase
MDISIVHHATSPSGAFTIEHDGRRLAALTYLLDGDIIVINHTEVDGSLRGTGSGGKLVDAAVQWARGEHRRIKPVCPFVKAVFDKTPAYHDVLAD